MSGVQSQSKSEPQEDGLPFAYAVDEAVLRKLLPHRPPILLIDDVIELYPGRRATAVKTLTDGDAVFAGHFPGNPIVPGALIVEACAQVTALTMSSVEYDPEGDSTPPIEYLGAIHRFKFYRTVSPGASLILRTRIGKRVGHILQALVTAHIGRILVADGEISVTSSRKNGQQVQQGDKHGSEIR